MKKIISIGLLFLSVTACDPKSDFSADESGTVVGTKEPLPDPASVVCDPFDSEHNGSSIYGVSGNLFYLRPEQPIYYSVNDYIGLGQPIDDLNLFMSRIYVPTRPFNRGFVTEAGETLRTSNGDTLYEYFAIRLRSQLILKNGQAPGRIQLAILSDDGAILSFGNNNGGYDEFINNDYTHPTKLKCATSALDIGATSRIPFQLDYFQGPRFHISLILMWRPWSDTENMNDPLCDYESNSEFFDSTQDPPVAGAAYNQLLARGWKTFETENFLLQEGVNPCGSP